MDKHSFSLRPPTQEEVSRFNSKLQALIAEESVQVEVVPKFYKSSDGKYEIGGELSISKKVALVSAEDLPKPVLSPLQPKKKKK